MAARRVRMRRLNNDESRPYAASKIAVVQNDYGQRPFGVWAASTIVVVGTTTSNGRVWGLCAEERRLVRAHQRELARAALLGLGAAAAVGAGIAPRCRAGVVVVGERDAEARRPK